MNIYQIWIHEVDFFWLRAAWDAESAAANPDVWRAAVEDVVAEYGAASVRVVKATIDFEAVKRTFDVPSVGALTDVKVVGS